MQTQEPNLNDINVFNSESIAENTQIMSGLTDELSLWSAPFGLKLLDVLQYKKNINVLDIGCGAGFPLLEISQRLGLSSTCYGIDPSEAAISRLKAKAAAMQLKNIRCFDCKAEEMPFDDEIFHLIVSNNGINNTENADLVLKEAYRTAGKNAQLVITANLPGTFSLFYECLTELLLEEGYYSVIEAIIQHISQKRKSIKQQIEMIEHAGFSIRHIYEENYVMKFLDGTAFLQHHFIKTAFKNHWMKIMESTDNADEIMSICENKLNEIAETNGGLQMEVPFVVLDCYKS
ncbi:MAG: class I SAM-dependent methyltransferase [Bacteroidetes bacterium]|nr:class I SAM-dependent methyltransferase [Bacteroidota bacterium]